MSGFLTHLASLALGVPSQGAANLSLPPRFAGLSAARGPMVDSVDVTNSSAPAEFETKSHPLAADTIHNADLRAGSTSTTARDHGRLPPPKFQGHASVQPAREQIQPLHPLDQPLQRSASPDNPPARHPQVPAPARTPALSRPPVTAPLSAPLRPLERPASTRAPSQAMPLREAVVASRKSVAREQAPVIHVTIDRIDVRAPSPAQAPPPQRRARQEPVVSLSDYLRGSEGGRG